MVLPVGLTAGATGHVSWHNQLHERFNTVTDVYNIKDPQYGAVGDGVANDTAAIAAAVAACPPGGTVLVPPGVYLTDAVVITKAIKLVGPGRFSSWLKPRTAIASGLVQFNLPSPSGGVRAFYGASVQGLGLDLSAAPAATGLAINANTGWFVGRDLYMQGGAVSVDNKGPNNRFELCRFTDAGKFFKVDGETGLELTLRDIDCTIYSGTTTRGIEVICTTSAIKGDLRLDNVVVNSGGGTLTTGLYVSSTATNLSVPVFANDLVIDNCSGPAVDLINVRDHHYSDSWFNSAAGTTAAVRIAGGGNLKFRGNSYFGGSSSGGTYEFVGAAVCDGFVSQGNMCPTAPVYKLTGAGKPTPLFLDDFIPGATIDAQVTNDLANLVAGTGRTWGGKRFEDKVTIGAVPALRPALSGVAVLAGGAATIANAEADSSSSDIYVAHRGGGSHLGVLYISSVTTGVGFVVGSTDALDDSVISWIMVQRVA